jgi:hypothetical protein
MRTAIPALALLVIACRPERATPPMPSDAAIPATPIDATTAASPRRPEFVERTAEDDAAWSLLGGVGRGPREAIVAHRGKLRLAHGGPIVADGGGAPTWEALAVVASERDALRVVAPASLDNVPLLVWLDIVDLAPQLAVEVVLQPLGKTKPGDGTVELAPGEEVDIVAREGDRVHVRTADERFAGWIDGSALTPSFERRGFERQFDDAELAPGTKLAVRPGGPALFELPKDGASEFAHLVSTQNGWSLVEYVQSCPATVRIRGYVRSKQVKPIEPMAAGVGCGHGYGRGPLSWGELADAAVVKLSVDTELRSPEGALVGRTLAQVELRRAPDGLLRVPTPWGLVPVTAD